MSEEPPIKYIDIVEEENQHYEHSSIFFTKKNSENTKLYYSYFEDSIWKQLVVGVCEGNISGVWNPHENRLEVYYSGKDKMLTCKFLKNKTWETNNKFPSKKVFGKIVTYYDHTKNNIAIFFLGENGLIYHYYYFEYYEWRESIINNDGNICIGDFDANFEFIRDTPGIVFIGKENTLNYYYFRRNSFSQPYLCCDVSTFKTEPISEGASICSIFNHRSQHTSFFMPNKAHQLVHWNVNKIWNVLKIPASYDILNGNMKGFYDPETKETEVIFSTNKGLVWFQTGQNKNILELFGAPNLVYKYFKRGKKRELCFAAKGDSFPRLYTCSLIKSEHTQKLELFVEKEEFISKHTDETNIIGNRILKVSTESVPINILSPRSIPLNPTKKLCLSIGISNYSNLDSVSHSVNDATTVAKKFKALDFDVDLLCDGSKEQIENAISSVVNKIESNTMIVFYFSGHAMEFNLNNYIFGSNGDSIMDSGVKLFDTLIKPILDHEEVVTLVMILDAGRRKTVPISKTKTNLQELHVRGCDDIEARKKIQQFVFIFATDPGEDKTEFSSKDGLSIFTKHFCENINEKREINQILKATNYSMQQYSQKLPWINQRLYNDIYCTKNAPEIKEKLDIWKSKKKISLCIGNNEYINNAGLSTSEKDAEGIDALLAEKKFPDKNRILIKSAKGEEMISAIKKLVENVEDETLIFFYFSGHGCEDIGGKNMLSGIDFKPVPLYDCLINEISKIEKKLALVVVLDCCRSKKKLSTKETSLLRKQHQFAYIYATQSGDDANSKRDSKYSVFTSHFLHHLRQKDEIVDVVKKTNFSMQWFNISQLPWMNHRLYQDIYLEN
eukprot:gene1346-11428_t